MEEARETGGFLRFILWTEEYQVSDDAGFGKWGAQRKITALHIAGSQGRAEVAEVLLQAGADVSARNMDHDTPLCLAQKAGNGETARVLIKAGAAVLTPSHGASQGPHPSVNVDMWEDEPYAGKSKWDVNKKGSRPESSRVRRTLKMQLKDSEKDHTVSESQQLIVAQPLYNTQTEVDEEL